MHKIGKSAFQINCPFFSEYAEKIDKLTRSIHGSRILSDKVESAQALLEIVNTLSSCSKYDGRTEDCFNCNFALNLRGEIARIIVEAAKPAS